MTEKVKINIPKDDFKILQREDEDKPVVAAVNAALVDFEQKPIFAWHMAVLFDLEGVNDDALPTAEETALLDPYCSALETKLREKGNALVLARINWNGTRELLLRVNNPHEADALLQAAIEEDKNPRPFSYSIDPDSAWQKADWYLKEFKA